MGGVERWWILVWKTVPFPSGFYLFRSDSELRANTGGRKAKASERKFSPNAYFLAHRQVTSSICIEARAGLGRARVLSNEKPGALGL
jgi:hypothetical protein